MKFGKQLQLGTYEPWKDHYIQYSKLKRIIRRRKFIADKNKDVSMSRNTSAVFNDNDSEDSDRAAPSSERTPLKIQPIRTASYNATATEFESQANIIAAKKESSDESIEFFPVIVQEMEKISKFFIGKLAELRIMLEDIVNARRNSYMSHHTSSSDNSSLLRLRDIYVELAALRSYSTLNKTGFYKIIKKYDKTLGEETLKQWMPTVNRQEFTTTDEPLRLMEVVTSLVSRDKLMEWERFATEQQLRGDKILFPSVSLYGLSISVIIFIVSLFVPILNSGNVQASRCLSLLLFTVSLWVTEAVPYFTTALMIPALVVFLDVLQDPTHPSKPMTRTAAAGFVLDHIFNHTTMLLLGGYTISTAFATCQLELRLASFLQKHLGDQPLLFILAIMFLGLFLSMWISNHTSPILCSALILPIVRDLPSDSKFSKALLLGLAFACNFGGMMTPISSLQNILAVTYLEQQGIGISFGSWICFSVPFCVLCTIISWLIIIIVVKPMDVKSIPVVVYERSSDMFDQKNIVIITSSLATIILFALFSSNTGSSTGGANSNVFGDIAIISLCYMTFMYGTGLLSEVDFNSLSWHTLFLVGGGNVLGKAVDSSGLLAYISNAVVPALPVEHPWAALCCILLFTLVISTFISHTVTSLILLPIIAKIGVELGIPVVVMVCSALAVSAAMALPFSSFPNVNSVLIVDDFQRPYLSVQDFVKSGLPMSIIAVVLVATIGYGLINVIIL